jgi:hypothetical protein
MELILVAQPVGNECSDLTVSLHILRTELKHIKVHSDKMLASCRPLVGEISVSYTTHTCINNNVIRYTYSDTMLRLSASYEQKWVIIFDK